MTRNRHDALFKATFSDVAHAAGELSLVLPPALVTRLDWSTLKLCPGSFVDPVLAQRHSDLLFSVSAAGRKIFVYVLFEHQSSVEALLPFRLLRYMVRIWEAHLREHPKAKRLPPLVPVVLHHSKRGWQGTTAFHDLFDLEADLRDALAAHMPHFRFVLDDVSRVSDESLRARAMSELGRIVLWCFKHARAPARLVTRIGAWSALMREARRAPGGKAAIERVLRYILSSVREWHPPDELVARLTESLGDELAEDIVTVAEQLREQGRKQGRVQTLLELLRLKFGPLPEAVVARVQGASPDELAAWTGRVLTATTLVDVLGEA